MDANQFCVFRGVSNSSWTLQHSLSRMGGDLGAKERRVLDDFRDFANLELKAQAVEVENPWQLMAVAQHHGTPTRLLDWSRNQDVALHFATSDRRSWGTEGCVWVVNPHLVHQTLPALLKQDLCGSGEAAPGLMRERQMLRALPAVADLDRQAVGPVLPAFFFEPGWADARIKAQNGLFSVVGDVASDLADVLETVPRCARRVHIGPVLKLEVRRKLDASGRDERSYFPGFDGVSAFLGRNHCE
ncbi:FRG domain-containing protein [Cellulomonas soli]|uniref:FRG domain-containing protein n=1 Tax=Cellulomonas soli TaxID=931535 RepID=UPI0015C96CEE|nr:FRG domain-containing protein [Cellulomonas soli]NYI60757.1 hypothetical protein [Cellulomonas soli]